MRYAIILSVILHFLAVVVLLLFPQQQVPHSPAENIAVEIVTMDKKPQEDQKSKRIVETEVGRKVEIPVKDSQLGFQNQVVDRQTTGKKTSIARESKNSKKSKQTIDLAKLGARFSPFVQQKEGSEHEWATPGASPEDYVAGMIESDRTALNTQEHKFYGYFQRIRSRLDQAWVPILRSKIVQYQNRGRRLASDMNYISRLLVTLSSTGEIIRVQLMSQSGTEDLDNAAIEAFNRAGPFPNPPRDMVDTLGQVRVSWDFILRT